MIYFKPSEFSGWYDQLDEQLKASLDEFRRLHGRPVYVSRANGAVGREDESRSQHNVARWGSVRAVDVFPRGVYTAEDAQQIYDLAVDAGFTGIGIYPQWNGGIGFHLDVRDQTFISSWSQVNDEYLSFNRGLMHIRNN